MPLRIGFDVDGVLADMDAELARQAEALFGERVARRVENRPPDPSQPAAPSDTPVVKLDLSPRQEHRLWDHVRAIENFWFGLKEFEPGVIARLSALAIERRWEIIFLTKRPDTAGETAQRQTQRWLQAKGFALPSVFVVQKSRGRIASALALDIVVDDRPENCMDVIVDSKARAIMVWRDGGAALPAAQQRLGIGVVSSLAECLEVIVELDTPEPRAGLLARVMKAFGRKGPEKPQAQLERRSIPPVS